MQFGNKHHSDVSSQTEVMEARLASQLYTPRRPQEHIQGPGAAPTMSLLLQVSTINTMLQISIVAVI
jgi:hypothetical protein